MSTKNNGIATAETVAQVVNEVKKVEAAQPKATLPAPVVNPPIEKRLAHLQKLIEISERREEIQNAIQKVEGFYITPSGNCKIGLTDSKNSSFNITHTGLVTELVVIVKDRLQKELDKLDKDFNFSI